MKTRKKAIALAAGALASVGVLLASNMGFRVPFTLLGPADSASGTNWLSLPYRTRPELQTAADLFADLGGGAAVASVSRWVPATGTYQVYAGAPQDDFQLVPGEGVRVIMLATVDYKIFGSHDPTRSITLLGPEDSLDGENWYAHPYNAQATTASQLTTELGAADVVTISRFLRASDSLQAYAPGPGATDFTLVAGEAYRIAVSRTLQFVPKTLP
jgi:hypothetical protein